MTTAANRVFAPSALHKCAMACVLVLSACTFSPQLGGMGAEPTPSEKQFTMGRTDRIWAEAPGAMVVTQRSTRSGGQQLVGLANDTSLAGDNFLWLNANATGGGQLGSRLRLEQVIARAGGVPSPFTTLDNRNLRSGEDSLGAFFWQEYRSGAQTNCVLAVRQLKGGARALPQGTRELEVVLRNCVIGTVEEALYPIRDTGLSRSIAAYAPPSAGSGRLLSPLAAPRP